MIVVKLGGSVITYKGGRPRVRSTVVHRLAHELAAASDDLVIVHGGGSFGHPEAATWGLHGEGAGAKIPKARLARGARRVNEAMSRLNDQVLAALRKAGLEPKALPGGVVAELRDGKLTSFDVTPFRSAFVDRLVPVTYGDAALDSKRGHAIVSGDALAFALAKRLRPRRVVFVTDRDGLYSAPPGERGASLAKRLGPRELSALGATGGDGRHDVTGGMAGKVKAIARIVGLGTPVVVVNGLVAGRLKDALRRKAIVGTTVSPRG